MPIHRPPAVDGILRQGPLSPPVILFKVIINLMEIAIKTLILKVSFLFISITPRQRFPTFFIAWHINQLLKFYGIPENIFFADMTKEDV